MSPTSYLTAPPRISIVTIRGGAVNFERLSAPAFRRGFYEFRACFKAPKSEVLQYREAPPADPICLYAQRSFR